MAYAKFIRHIIGKMTAMAGVKKKPDAFIINAGGFADRLKGKFPRRFGGSSIKPAGGAKKAPWFVLTGQDLVGHRFLR